MQLLARWPCCLKSLTEPLLSDQTCTFQRERVRAELNVMSQEIGPMPHGRNWLVREELIVLGQVGGICWLHPRQSLNDLGYTGERYQVQTVVPLGTVRPVPFPICPSKRGASDRCMCTAETVTTRHRTCTRLLPTTTNQLPSKTEVEGGEHRFRL